MTLAVKFVPLSVLLAIPVSLAPLHVSAASVSGAFTVDLSGTLSAIFDTDTNDISSVRITGDIGTANSISGFRTESAVGWTVTGEISTPDISTITVRESDPTPRPWAGFDATAVNNFYTDGASSLFSLITFFNRTVSAAFATVPTLSGGPQMVGGIDGVSWTYAPISSDFTGFVGAPTFGAGAPLTTQSTFVFTIDGTANSTAFLNLLGDLDFPMLSMSDPSRGFEATLTAAAIPVPAALPLLAGGLGLLGLMGWRQRRVRHIPAGNMDSSRTAAA